MPFAFYRYIAPVWYFHLPGAMRWADYRRLSPAEQALIDYDAGYPTADGALADAAWQAWLKGAMETDPTRCLDPQALRLTPADNYRFLRRHLHPFWSWYALALRLLGLKHPLREARAFIAQRRARRIDPFAACVPHAEALAAFDSPLLRERPMVSVIIPTLNRYAYLKDALHDLERQDYTHFDVIIVDQSEPFQPAFYDAFQLDIKVIRQEEKALWLARNTAVKNSDAEYLLLYDDDSRTKPDWISQHLRCLDIFGADISSGVSISVRGAKAPQNYSFFRWGDQVDTGNVMIRRQVFREIGLFDRQFEKQRQGDGEFGLRAYLAGFRNVSNPLAGRLHLKVGEGGLRQMGSWDAFRPKNWLAPRPVPSVLYFARKYFGRRAALYSLLIGVPPSLMPYRLKRKPWLLVLGSLMIIPLAPLVLWQVWRSWQIATRMLREGAKIEQIDNLKQ
ncbi:MAG: glycosyltransferase family 2 protein [Saprospiraceae bacterium]